MSHTRKLNDGLSEKIALAYDQCGLKISDFIYETEGIEYKACKFKLNGLNIICRTSKITPKKVGQFVTFWKRNKAGITTPFEDSDQIDFYLINVIKNDRIGQFLFPKSILIEKRIITTTSKDGKLGFRVYPAWDAATNKQAKKTQTWQLKYFIEYENKVDLENVSKLFQRV